MGLLDDLKELGVDVDEGIGRVMGDRSLYEMMLGMFISTVESSPISAEDFDGADLKGLIDRVHKLKGITGNLSMTPLFAKYMEVLSLLRAGQSAQARAGFEQIVPIQTEIADCIKRHTGAR